MTTTEAHRDTSPARPPRPPGTGRVDECPVCGGEGRFAYGHPEADIYRCPSCSHCYSDPGSMPAQQEYDDAYFDETHENWCANPNVELFRRIADHVEAADAKPSVIDVGCGRGDFLRYLHGVVPAATLTGIDLSENEPAEGMTLMRGDVFTLAEDDRLRERFDVVTSLAVIEHVPDIRAFVAGTSALCRPGGTIVVMTLDEGSLLYVAARALRAIGVRLAFDRLYSRHHLHHFTNRSLLRLLEVEGLDVVEVIHHNVPMAAIDIPVRSRLMDVVLRLGVGALFTAGRLTRRTYLQTIVCRKLATT